MGAIETEHFKRVIQTAWQNQEGKLGYTNPNAVASEIAPHMPSVAPEYIARAFKRMPTQDFLYPKTKETVRNLLESGDHIIIWTQGDKRTQLWKVATSGLGQIRRELPSEKRTQLQVFADIDKFSAIPTILDNLAQFDIEQVIVVDDKSANIANLNDKLLQWQENGQIPEGVNIRLVWINQGRTKNQVPPGYSLDRFKNQFTTVEDIRELPTLKGDGDHKTAWLIDYDHTLAQTNSARESLFQNLAEELSFVSHISSLREAQKYLGERIHAIRRLKGGVSGSQVFRLDTDRGSVVIKYNPDEPEKISHEISGYEILSGTPFGTHMLSPHQISESSGIIALPFFPGVSLREGLKNGTLPTQMAQTVLKELLAIKQEWWASQPKLEPNGDLVSMQRREWSDTLAGANEVLLYLSEKFNIAVDDLINLPVEIDGKRYPSVRQTIEAIDTLLLDYPPYAILDHGDTSGGNIIMDGKSGVWKALDPEWAGFVDPAEALVRDVKYVSTTTATGFNVDAHLNGGTLILKADVIIPPSCQEMETYGMSQVNSIAQTQQDPTFAERFKTYLGGSHLREMALVLRRSSPELAIFSMARAVQAISG